MLCVFSMISLSVFWLSILLIGDAYPLPVHDASATNGYYFVPAFKSVVDGNKCTIRVSQFDNFFFRRSLARLIVDCENGILAAVYI